jgi:hypothetical protein
MLPITPSTGPFKIIDVKECYGTYCLAELDGSVLKDYQDGSRLKHFYTRPLLSTDDLGSGVEPPAADDVPMDDVWEVFDILDKRMNNGQKEYKVK